MIIRLLALLAACLAAGASVQAHEVRPAYVEITRAGPGEFRVLWKQPVVGAMALPLRPELSTGWLDRPPNRTLVTPGYRIQEWAIVAPAATDLAGERIAIAGLDESITDVLVRIVDSGGVAQTMVLTPAKPQQVIDGGNESGFAVGAYLELGFRHVLEGLDHLAFLIGVLLVVGLRWRVVGAVTAFTVAHSITLALAVTGLVRFPPLLVELLVALSIVFVALEALRVVRGGDSLTVRKPWIVAFVFGLLHGFAFAGALAQIGMPADAAISALFLFNLGIEIGQVAVLACVSLLALASLRILPALVLHSTRIKIAAIYCLGGMAAFWSLERAGAALGA